MSRRRHPDQLDLLGWEPREPVCAFEAHTVRAASLGASISKGVSQALRACGLARKEAATRMSEFLDEKVSEDILNAYASEAKGVHIINVVRFIGLIHVTRDIRLLQFIAEMFGWAVVDKKYLPLIEMAQLQEHRATLDRRLDAARRQAKAGGAL